MATLAIGAVGAAIGLSAGNATLGWAVGTMVGGLFNRPHQQPARLDDYERHVTGCQYGTMIPQVYGLCRIGGSVIWGTDIQERTQYGAGGGKVSSRVTERYYYTASLAVAVCRGPITRVRRIWADDKVIYDYTASPTTEHTIRIYLGTETQTADSLIAATEGADNTPAYRGMAYVVFEDLDLTAWGNRLPNLSFEVEVGSPNVASILMDIAGQVGVVSGDRDFSAATTAVTGYLVSSRQAARDAIDPLLRVYAVDLAEVDDQIVAVPRGGSSLATVAAGDLGAAAWISGRDPEPAAETTRGQDMDLPRAIDLAYLSASESYDQRTQRAVRNGYEGAQDAQTVNVPLVMTADAARQAAERMLRDAWMERQQVTTQVGPRWWTLPPAGVVTIPVDGVATRLRIVRADVGLMGPMRLEMVQESADTLTQTATGDEPTYTPPAVSAPVPSVFTAWIGKEIVDEDGIAPGFYVASYGSAGWSGGTIYYSPDAGVSWVVGGAIRDAAIWGDADTALGDWADPATWDTTHTVDVTVGGGVPAPAAQAEVDDGTNYLLIGGEQAGFATVTALGGGSYRLGTLRRGRRSTPMTGHAAGDLVVVVTSAVARVSVDSALVGQSVPVKVVSYGESLADVTAVNVTIAANNYPYEQGGAAATAVAGHAGESDPHAQYALVAGRTGEDLTVQGYLVAGAGNVAWKRKLITGTTPATQGATVSIAHGVADHTKIFGIGALIQFANGAKIIPNACSSAGYEYLVYVSAADPSKVVVETTAANSANVLDTSIAITIDYQE